jgi:FkbM family methyltransferase
MLDFTSLIKANNIHPRGIIQLGAHHFQERDVFTALGVKNFVLVEPQKQAFEIMKERAKSLNAHCFNLAVSNERGFSIMNCDNVNEGQSSSLLKPKDHLVIYPHIEFPRTETVEVELLENLHFDWERYNIIVMDLQGNELNAMKGAGNLLNYIDAIYSEVNFREMYENCCLVEQLDEYLHKFGFKRITTGPDFNNQGWSDAFYIKEKQV